MKFILLVDGREDVADVRLKHHTGHDNFIENVMNLVTVKYQIKFANIFKTFIQRF